MPSRVPREHVRHLGGAIPTLVLYSAEPIVQFPIFRLSTGRPAVCTGWTFRAGLTVSIINGPGTFELLVDGISEPDEVDMGLAWSNAVERAGGAVVMVVDRRCMTFDWTAAAGTGRVRGGFVPAMRKSR
ncbi:hypothetical protein [Nonomuraea sp. NPDC002799]